MREIQAWIAARVTFNYTDNGPGTFPKKSLAVRLACLDYEFIVNIYPYGKRWHCSTNFINGVTVVIGFVSVSLSRYRNFKQYE